MSRPKVVLEEKKINKLLNKLEYMVSGSISDGDYFYPDFETKADGEKRYTGNVLQDMVFDEDDTPTLNIGTIPDEDDAVLFCEAVNALPTLLAYIRKLERKVVDTHAIVR